MSAFDFSVNDLWFWIKNMGGKITPRGELRGKGGGEKFPWPTKYKIEVQPIASNILETRGWPKLAPHNDFSLFSTLRGFTGGGRPTEAFEVHTTPGGARPSYDIVRSVVDLAFVVLELQKVDPPRPRSLIRCTAAT